MKIYASALLFGVVAFSASFAKCAHSQSLIGSPTYTPVSAVTMARDFTLMGEAQNQDPYRFGGNFTQRRGCILSLCPKLVSINNFSFGNTGMDRSLFLYKWTIHDPRVVSFSISAIEYDPFGHPLPSETWVIPIDDRGESRRNTPGDASPYYLDGKGLSPGTYTSRLPGASSSAQVLKPYKTPGIIPPELKKYLPYADAPGRTELHNGLPSPVSGFGTSTRYTVVTFVSAVRYGDGSGASWDTENKSVFLFSDLFDGGGGRAALTIAGKVGGFDLADAEEVAQP